LSSLPPLLFSPFSSLLSPPPTAPLFPYTTLFRSNKAAPALPLRIVIPVEIKYSKDPSKKLLLENPLRTVKLPVCVLYGFVMMLRSEEHTSELQSRFDLVCRLLLEKKKKKI